MYANEVWGCLRVQACVGQVAGGGVGGCWKDIFDIPPPPLFQSDKKPSKEQGGTSK